MRQKYTYYFRKNFRLIVVLALVLGFVLSTGEIASVRAAAPLPQNPQNGTVGLEATISSPPPSRAATISTPVNGRTYTQIPVAVNGICPQGTMVKMFANNIFVGSARCTNGSFSLEIDLFSGQNDLVARVFDDLDQAGPDSNVVRVTFNDSQLSAFGNRVSVSSAYAKLGANPGDKLTWPLIISGGTGPFAISVDWGDGKPFTLLSVPFTGVTNVDHVYDAAGIYRIVVKVTDVNGSSGYLQLIGVANGEGKASIVNAPDSAGSSKTIIQTRYSAWPSLVAIPLIFAAFWLGRKYELQTLRRRIEESTSNEYNR